MYPKTPEPIAVEEVPTPIEEAEPPEPIPPPPPPKKIVVTGIVYSASRPSVVIEQFILHEGDTIHGARILRIGRYEVELQRGEKRWVVKPGERDVDE